MFRELKTLIKEACVPSARSMLAMTCRQERREVINPEDHSCLFLYLIREGNPMVQFLYEIEDYLDRFVNTKHPLMLGRCHHDLLHEVIPTGNLKLLQWLEEGLAVRCDEDTCVAFAVKQGLLLLIKHILANRTSTWDKMDSYDMNTAVVTALRCNNASLIQDLFPGLLEKDAYPFLLNFDWDHLYWSLPEENPNLCLVDYPSSLAWIDSYYRQYRGSSVSRKPLLRDLQSALIRKQWDRRTIQTWIKQNFPGSLLRYYSLYMQQPQYVSYLAAGLLWNNALIYEWAIRKFLRWRGNMRVEEIRAVVESHTKDNLETRKRAMDLLGLK